MFSATCLVLGSSSYPCLYKMLNFIVCFYHKLTLKYSMSMKFYFYSMAEASTEFGQAHNVTIHASALIVIYFSFSFPKRDRPE